ncbi:MAG: hypothetical protein NO474_04170 [Methanomassiliicoccales archaeon]|nr:hypothetical protein [Methanomassiliicoccales archaeon]
MAPKDAAKEEDWFAQLDAELEQKTEAITKDLMELNNQKRMINRTLIEDFWKIWMRFGKINVHFTMEPSYSAFAQFDEFPDQWRFREDFNFAGVNTIQLVDRTQEQGRMGDSLKIWYYNEDSTPHIRMVFEYCEGEHYYKYSGWKRIFGQFVIYDAPLAKFDMDKFHEKLADVVKAWYESHLRRNRDILIKHLKDNYERGETFTE